MSARRDYLVAAANRLKSDKYFTSIPVNVQDKGSIQSEIDQAIIKTGIGVIILNTDATIINADIPEPHLQFEVTVRVVENVPVNQADGGTKKSAEDVAEVAFCLLHHYRADKEMDIFRPSPGKTLTQIDVEDMPQLLVYELRFTVHTGLRYIPQPI